MSSPDHVRWDLQSKSSSGYVARCSRCSFVSDPYPAGTHISTIAGHECANDRRPEPPRERSRAEIRESWAERRWQWIREGSDRARWRIENGYGSGYVNELEARARREQSGFERQLFSVCFCGFTISVRNANALKEAEKRHRAECARKDRNRLDPSVYVTQAELSGVSVALLCRDIRERSRQEKLEEPSDPHGLRWSELAEHVRRFGLSGYGIGPRRRATVLEALARHGYETPGDRHE